MRPLDWVVMFAWLISLVSYGLYRGRGSNTVNKYLLAGRTMPWYAMGLSIMATQASAITFISTTGQGYVDGMRFVQFYFGLPIAMVILSATAVPIFHRAKVYTAYEYLEQRFDAKTRALVSIIFLIAARPRCRASVSTRRRLCSPMSLAGRTGSSPCSSARWLFFTPPVAASKPLTWADVQQMSMIFVALVTSLIIVLHACRPAFPSSMRCTWRGQRDASTSSICDFDWNDRYNVWSGLIGGVFLALAYFGCDQSQVQRYLTGKSIAQSRLSLLFNAIAKIPMQLFILFIGAMVFVLSLFVQSPIIFQPLEAQHAAATPSWKTIESNYQKAFEHRRDAAYTLAGAIRQGDPKTKPALSSFRQAQGAFTQSRQQALQVVQRLHGGQEFDDTNYIFLTFVKTYLPLGLVGLVIGVIFSASMGSTSGEINSLATVSVVDIYRRYFVRNRDDHHYLLASRFLTVFWGAYAVAFAVIGARGFGALIVRVNIVGSLFYGGMLGVFVLAFFFKHVRGTAAFWGVLAGETAIFIAALFTQVSFLWYNVIGCVVVVATALAITKVRAV